jgi:hypothetical protein
LPCRAMKLPSMVFRVMEQFSYSVKEPGQNCSPPEERDAGAGWSKAKTSEAAQFTDVNMSKPSLITHQLRQANGAAVVIRRAGVLQLQVETGCAFIGELMTRILRTPRSRRICGRHRLCAVSGRGGNFRITANCRSSAPADRAPLAHYPATTPPLPSPSYFSHGARSSSALAG